MFEQEQQAITDQIRTLCAGRGLPAPELTWSPIPFSGEWGISTSFFQLAAVEGRMIKEQTGQGINVPQRAQELAALAAEHLGKPAGFARLEAVKGYLNLYFDPAEYAQRVVETALAQGAQFGRGAPKGQRVMVEFSQPNTHKAFHVGHLRSAILGDALARILEYAGYDVVRANYLGDMGLHVIKWLWNYMKHHAGEKPTSDTTRWMGEIYAEANRRLEENPELEAEVRALYVRWDHREPDVVEAWQRTRQWSLDGFEEMYKTLDIRFDRMYFNSEEEQPGKQVVDELLQRGIAIDERPDGPVIVKLDELLGLDKEKYRVLVVLRSDGTALYSTEDLALGIKKFTEYPDMAKSIYVVDTRQSLHFQQIFKTLELAGYPWADRCLHLNYEIVNLPGNVVMASRDGTVVLLENLIREAIQRSRQVVEEKNPDLSESQKQDVARAVGLGALRYPMLARDHAKVVTFDWESALDFNGQAAPYIQYAHVRANSILRRQEIEQVEDLALANFQHQLEPTEIQLIDILSRFPSEVQRAASEYRTLHITNLAYELAKSFSDFYNACPVLKAQPAVRDARLRLVAATRQTIANALNLLGIEAPPVM
ncbi:MAG TPA: arginine--tRNA ligase [Anaerolineales bacterium]|nr:arginine--tRNA ligase [Anaerolineales bacterium]